MEYASSTPTGRIGYADRSHWVRRPVALGTPSGRTQYTNRPYPIRRPLALSTPTGRTQYAEYADWLHQRIEYADRSQS